MYWEELKPTLKKEELSRHPARFMLTELVNLYDPAIVFYPIHRLVKEVETEAFCDFFMKNVKCRREGNVLIPALPAGAEGVRRTDELCEAFVRVNGGTIDYVHGTKNWRAARGRGCAGGEARGDGERGLLPRAQRGRQFSQEDLLAGRGKGKAILSGRQGDQL